jgi:hypothetical protein
MKLKIKVDVKGFVCNNFWWKVTALIMAVITWLYVSRELNEFTKGIKI